MTKSQLYLLLIASFSLLFIGLMGLGSYFWAQHNRGVALAFFLFAFASVFGQMGALALYLRQRARLRWLQQQNNDNAN